MNHFIARYYVDTLQNLTSRKNRFSIVRNITCLLIDCRLKKHRIPPSNIPHFQRIIYSSKVSEIRLSGFIIYSLFPNSLLCEEKKKRKTQFVGHLPRTRALLLRVPMGLILQYAYEIRARQKVIHDEYLNAEFVLKSNHLNEYLHTVLHDGYYYIMIHISARPFSVNDFENSNTFKAADYCLMEKRKKIKERKNKSSECVRLYSRLHTCVYLCSYFLSSFYSR